MEQTSNSNPILYQKENPNTSNVSSEAENQEILKVLIHDIKNPMSSLMGYLGLLSTMAKSLDAKQKQYIMNSTWASNELAFLCRNIEDSISMESKRLQPRLERLQAGPILQKNVEKLHSIAEYFQKKLLCSIPESLPPIQGDKNLIDRMFYTIINQSLQNCPNGKEVKISLGKKEKNLFLEVEDEGPAILEEHLEKYFDKFFSTYCGKGVRRPKGWDAYFCKLVATLHGGEIYINKIEKRQIFSVLLPYEATL